MSILSDCGVRITPKVDRILAYIMLASVTLVMLAKHYELDASIRSIVGFPALFYVVLLVGTKANIWSKPNQNERLLRVLESSEQQRTAVNIQGLHESRSTNQFTTEEAIELHQQVITAIASWDENHISELHQFALGTRAGWKQSGFITQKQYVAMLKDIDQSVLNRLRTLT